MVAPERTNVLVKPLDQLGRRLEVLALESPAPEATAAVGWCLHSYFSIAGMREKYRIAAKMPRCGIVGL